MSQNQTTWNYKGLNCIILKFKGGNTYSVYDVGAVTGEPIAILYHGSPKGFTKEDVEKAVDDYFKKLKTHPISTCQHYLQAVQNRGCSFTRICNDKDCKFAKDNLIEDLKNEVKDLERDIEDLESREN